MRIIWHNLSRNHFQSCCITKFQNVPCNIGNVFRKRFEHFCENLEDVPTLSSKTWRFYSSERVKRILSTDNNRSEVARIFREISFLAVGGRSRNSFEERLTLFAPVVVRLLSGNRENVVCRRYPRVPGYVCKIDRMVANKRDVRVILCPLVVENRPERFVASRERKKFASNINISRHFSLLTGSTLRGKFRRTFAERTPQLLAS